MTSDVKPGLVSVVVTSYNHSKFLVKRMDSLINQTYRNIEILVIDDCSTQNNVEILRRYELNPKVRLIIREQNGGLVPVMNQGIDLTCGEFVMIAQCDDDCDPRLIERLVAALKTHPTAGIAFSRSLMIDEHDRVMGDDFSSQERRFRVRCGTDTLVSGPEMSRFLLYSCVIPNMSALLIRRECLTNVGTISSDYAVCVDWEPFFRITARYDVCYVAEPLNRFRQHKATIRSVTKDRVTYEEYLRLLLGQARALNLAVVERCRFRARFMFLWAVHLVSPSWSGLINFPYHLRIVVRYDSRALVFLLPSLVLRFVQVVGKMIFGRQQWMTERSN